MLDILNFFTDLKLNKKLQQNKYTAFRVYYYMNENYDFDTIFISHFGHCKKCSGLALIYCYGVLMVALMLCVIKNIEGKFM